jgi:hypothetical protein
MQETHLTARGIHRVEVKRQTMIFQANGILKKAGVTILIPIQQNKLHTKIGRKRQGRSLCIDKINSSSRRHNNCLSVYTLDVRPIDFIKQT